MPSTLFTLDQGRLGSLAFGDVLDDPFKVTGLALRISDDADVHPSVPQGAVFSSIAVFGGQDALVAFNPPL